MKTAAKLQIIYMLVQPHRLNVPGKLYLGTPGFNNGKKQTGLNSHRSRLNPYWHLYMKQTYQYPFVAKNSRNRHFKQILAETSARNHSRHLATVHSLIIHSIITPINQSFIQSFKFSISL